MKNYELIVERHQPSCGGKTPWDNKVMNVATDDPVEYVRKLEKLESSEQLQVSAGENGETVIELTGSAVEVRYTFSEE